MSLFKYFTPTKVVFGKDAELQAGELIKKRGCQKVLIHFGGQSARRSGLLEKIEKSLQEQGLDYAELGGVVPNPRLSLVYEGIELCRKEQVDFILAIGGGSVIDSAKAIGYGAANDGDVWDFYTRARTPAACLPVGSVLTIAAAGSEMSLVSVITNEDGWYKRSCRSELSYPVFALINPELTMTLPAYQTASGCTDILMHTMERYFTRSEPLEMTDGISRALLQNVMKQVKILLKDPRNYKARAEVMWAGSLSHNGLTEFCTDGGDWATHKLEHELGAMFDVAHGAGLAAVWGSWARYVYKEGKERFLKFALEIMEVEPQPEEEQTILRGIIAMEEFFRSIGMPASIKELGIEPTEEQVLEMARKCSLIAGGKIGRIKPLYEEDMAAIYRMAR
jgi:alcohol dehydrogenase YqhD (iron-dependent ADH family)